MTDPIADLLTQLRNALQVKHQHILVPASKIKYAILEILTAEGFIKKAEIVNSKNGQEIKLINYNNFHTSQLNDWWCHANIPYSLSKSWNRYRNHCLSCVLFNQLYDL